MPFRLSLNRPCLSTQHADAAPAPASVPVNTNPVSDPAAGMSAVMPPRPQRPQTWTQSLSRLGLWRPAIQAWLTQAHWSDTADGRRLIHQRINDFLRDNNQPPEVIAPHNRGLLNLSEMRLVSLPSLLPPGVTKLDLSLNQLVALPNHLLSSLEELLVADNRLIHLPSPLPASLRKLDVSDNQLTTLAGPFPLGLERLEANNNRLSAIPDHLPPRLELLSLRGNQLSVIPAQDIQRLSQMDASAWVDLSGNPLSLQTLNDLAQLLGSPGYRGPRIVYTRNGPAQAAAPRRPTRPAPTQVPPAPVSEQPPPLALSESEVMRSFLTSLAPETANELRQMQQAAAAAGAPMSDEVLMSLAQEHVNVEPLLSRQAAQAEVPPLLETSQSPETPETRRRTSISAILRRWRELCAEPGEQAFTQFLARLCQTVNFENPDFRRKLTQWLHHLDTHPELRRDTFALSVGATVSCEDRVSHTYNAMRQLRLAFDVGLGKYDQRLPKLIRIARSMFRLDQLEIIAREQAQASPAVDEVEVYLAYQVMLRERLTLRLDTVDMRFASYSGVTPLHLDQAQSRVQEAERKHFANYLYSDWQPWQSVLKRLAPEQYAQVQEELIEAMGEEFSDRLTARLALLGLEDDADAQRIVGPQIQAEITQEINGRFTRDFLVCRGHSRLIPLDGG